jgi:hypothetical protein
MMDRIISIRTGIKTATAVRFVAIGLLMYAILFAGSEWLVRKNGHLNPLFKIEAAQSEEFDWVIIGASHAMPLDFGGFNQMMERATGLTIMNLAGPGTGPLYNRLVIEHFLGSHRTNHILYVADGFAFRSPMWNEDRLSDTKLLGRTPFSVEFAIGLARFCLQESVDPRAVLDYVTGFSKINNRDRFSIDVWEGEGTFDRAFKQSVSAERKRAEYLYPAVDNEADAQRRYMSQLTSIIETAHRNGAQVTIAKFPLPARFRALLKGEAEFDAKLQQLASRLEAEFVDFSNSMDGPQYYADTDHLNRTGVTVFFERHLKLVLTTGEQSESAW